MTMPATRRATAAQQHHEAQLIPARQQLKEAAAKRYALRQTGGLFFNLILCFL
jgi:hypothetical protein